MIEDPSLRKSERNKKVFATPERKMTDSMHASSARRSFLLTSEFLFPVFSFFRSDKKVSEEGISITSLLGVEERHTSSLGRDSERKKNTRSCSNFDVGPAKKGL